MPRQFCIYGDNIVECERMIKIISSAVKPTKVSTIGNPTAPQCVFNLPSGNMVVSMFPGFGRWKNDIIRYIRANGGILREAPDIVLTSVNNGIESPLLAVEFCSALPAGNQAWQRSGRAYSTAKSGIPYIFITEIGGYELDSHRKKKAPRMPNPAVPFSYFSFAETSGSQMSIAYQMNPGADDKNKSLYADSICGGDLADYVRTFILGGDPQPCLDRLNAHLLRFVFLLANGKRNGHLNATDWRAISKEIKAAHNASATIKASCFQWKKKISIPTTPTFSKFFAAGLRLCMGVASCDLPFAVVKEENLADFYNVLRRIYGDATQKFSAIPTLNHDLVVCWYAGFKPRGDDARPDRGVLPLARMLLGDDIPIMTVIYGPAPSTMTDRLESNPTSLMVLNGLWEATIGLSDFVICDSLQAKHPVLQLGRMHEMRMRKPPAPVSMPTNTKHFPEEDYIGENDVDSILHAVFAHLLKEKCRELMCNPPGGDWSGVSLFNCGEELRWLTLPRVSAKGFKRPDHVIQIDDAILSIESKNWLSNLESGIGPRLNGYCREIFKSRPSCRRWDGTQNWNDKTDDFRCPRLKFVSACAFLESGSSDLHNALVTAKTDIAIGIQFRRNYTPIVRFAFAKTLEKDVSAVFRGLHADESMQIEFQLT